MANIKDKVLQIRQAIFGKDVRESIASGIEEINKEVENNSTRQLTVEEKQSSLEVQFEEQIKNITLQDPSSAELVAARTKEDGTMFPTIGKRLNEIDLHSTEIVVTDNPPSIPQRGKGTFYFVTSDKKEIPTETNENIRVSPTMGIKKV